MCVCVCVCVFMCLSLCMHVSVLCVKVLEEELKFGIFSVNN